MDTQLREDYLQADTRAKEVMERYSARCVSVVSALEILEQTPPEKLSVVEAFMASFTVLPLDIRVLREARKLQKKYQMPMVSAMIWATARTHQMPLVAADWKPLPMEEKSIVLAYS